MIIKFQKFPPKLTSLEVTRCGIDQYMNLLVICNVGNVKQIVNIFVIDGYALWAVMVDGWKVKFVVECL